MIIGIALIVIILAGLLFLKLYPQLGGKSEGKRLERIISSPHFEQKLFQNQVKTSMDIPPGKVFKEFMSKGTDRKPAKPIQTLPISLDSYTRGNNGETIITWLGHSTLLIKTGGVTILTDPVFSKRASMVSFMGPEKFDYTTDYRVEDLPPVDIVVISHDHYDHLDYSAIQKLKKNVKKFYMPLGVGAHLERWGVELGKIVELDWWESTTFENLELVATPARHFTGRKLDDRFKTLWCGWVIKSEKHNLFFTGDSGYWDGFKTIGEKYGPFDFTMVECGQYHPYWASIHMSPEESAQAAYDLKSIATMPIHWGKFNLSLHPWNEPPARFVVKAAELTLKVTTPVIGETFSLNKLPENEWWR